jgi:hypothetical protein
MRNRNKLAGFDVYQIFLLVVRVSLTACGFRYSVVMSNKKTATKGGWEE